MKKTIKLFGIIILGIIFYSCDNVNSSVDRSNIDHIMIEKYIQSDSTIISDDYLILKKDSYKYVFNSEKELIAVYNTDNSDIYYYCHFLIIIVLLFGILLSNTRNSK